MKLKILLARCGLLRPQRKDVIQMCMRRQQRDADDFFKMFVWKSEFSKYSLE